MTVREIQAQLHGLYGTEISAGLISEVTDEVLVEVKAWQSRPLGLNEEGQKEVLGLWSSANERLAIYSKSLGGTNLMKRMVIAAFIATNLLAADSKAEIAQLMDALHGAAVAHDSDAYVRLLASDFNAVTRTGMLRDRHSAGEAVKSGGPPADLKSDAVSTSTYGDTIIQIRKELWTASNGTKTQTMVTLVFVKQEGAWKLAARSSVDLQASR